VLYELVVYQAEVLQVMQDPLQGTPGNLAVHFFYYMYVPPCFLYFIYFLTFIYPDSVYTTKASGPQQTRARRWIRDGR